MKPDKVSKTKPTKDPKNREDEVAQMTNGNNYGTNYALFRWNGSQWDVIENACDYGCVPIPPDAPGGHVGHLVPTACEPMWEGMQRPPSEQA